MTTIRRDKTTISEDEMTHEEYGAYVVGAITRAEDRAIYGITILEPEPKEPNWDAIRPEVKEINDGVRIRYCYKPRWNLK